MIVSLVKCEEYDYDRIRGALLRTFDNIGGIDRFVQPGDRILLKTNLLMKKTPEEATTTNPVFVQALADILMSKDAIVVIGDSPGGPFMEGRMKNIYKSTGMEEAAKRSGASLNFNLASYYTEFDNAVLLNKVILTDMINDVDKIINLPKLKTHGFAVYTGAVKNLFGLIPGTIKAEYHVNMPDVNNFCNALIDICEHVKPVLHIMDGIVGMEGAGPSGGRPRKIGAILASENPYDLDKTACEIIGLKVQDVPTLRKAAERGLSSDSMEDVEIAGDRIEDVLVPDFEKAPAISGSLRNIPLPVIKFLAKRLKSRPVFNFDICVGCGDCAANCPPKVIEMTEGKPVVDYVGCISCFCCQELCPVKAIEIKKPLLSKLIFR
ncbi:Uncharacterized conserved protein, DUF362 family [Dethiosulfatibacter aminovorans DSM 17477]|uniref:Uncharacterized conserved protein, DUF362 family n=1 Tax=Dethiosulfatibacter aminovorans DSM 17477 TaxID=1121476 RepID=A0A1M6F5T2_9FIRM|nr:DUF362 domain-containing protein [Dethiosulfatibacter aminovorans]SHI93078.1 Uncharacterized conserved protein, DUF362 family [Dethiosulfatibacter aminovorans DSM 17477]